ncbi:hypothetical protein M23134_03915 [Microscilla marina ATCC 23134]|uniref:Uncharacterized protein n=2 Tax=Microscilla marina ATCC 23134 TaxID=313606 RepID=A1ZMI3_MICM2|nr:hypothetical protein M23134_03915 [Microscilla marina ATCC 23134]
MPDDPCATSTAHKRGDRKLLTWHFPKPYSSFEYLPDQNISLKKKKREREKWSDCLFSFCSFSFVVVFWVFLCIV